MSDIVFKKKKRMTQKMMDLQKYYAEHQSHGTRVKGFILNSSNKCNFQCPHCYTRSGAGEFGTTDLSIEDIKSLADQADEMGVYEIDIQGGEPLINPDLFEILKAIGTERFYIYITTNGWLLDNEMAHRLADGGVDRVSVSIDAFSQEEHDYFRKKEGSYERCIEALEAATQAGMRAYVNIVVGHYNAKSKELKKFLDFLEEKKYGIVFNCASPTGNWRGNYDVMLDSEDQEELRALKEKHPNIIRDLWNYLNPADKKLIYGCPAVNLFYVSPLGDILPCPYIHVKLGNIHDEPLRDIINRGFAIPEFRDYSDKCLVGENREFAVKYLDRDMSVLKPLLAEDVFDLRINGRRRA
ncbi:MAG: radical SAM protein [Lachnospiraceae bacterium]|nr:radical SAM protein [Lachnospiraceae bacterium]